MPWYPHRQSLGGYIDKWDTNSKIAAASCYSSATRSDAQRSNTSCSEAELSKISQLTNNRLVLPSLIFAIGLSGLDQPLREAHKVGIPIIAIVDSDCNPRIANQ